MTAEHAQPQPVNPGHNPAAIRAVLPEADRAAFEQSYAGALDEAKRTFSLDALVETLEQWRRTAVVKQSPHYRIQPR